MLQKEKQSKKVLRNVLLAFVLMLIVTAGVKLDAKAAEKTYKLKNDESHSGSWLKSYSEINLNGHKLIINDNVNISTDIKFVDKVQKGTVEFKGNVTTSAGIRVAEYTTFIVDGDYTQTSGWLHFGDAGSIIKFKKNVTFQNKAYMLSFYGSPNGPRSPEIYVDGNMDYSSTVEPSNISGTVLSIKGNLLQKGSGFLHLGRLILNGKNSQKLLLTENSTLEYLNVKNSEISMEGYLNGTTLESNFEPTMESPLKTNLGINFNGKTVTLPAGLEAKRNIILGDKGSLHITGNLVMKGNMKCSNATLVVEGNYTHTENILDGSNATIKVMQNLEFNQFSSIRLDENSSVWVGKDFIFNPNGASTENKCKFDVYDYINPNGKKLSYSKLIIRKNEVKKRTVIDIFDDVNENDWFVDAVQFVCDNDFMCGVSDTRFGAANQLTREQMVTIIYRMAGSPEVEFETTFTDVKENDYFANAVVWATNKGIVAGVSATKFGTKQEISREMLATMLYRYAKMKNYILNRNDNALNKFNDKSQVSDWASEAMKWAVTNGIMNGKSNTTLDPKGKTTRAEAAKMINNFCDNVIR